MASQQLSSWQLPNTGIANPKEVNEPSPLIHHHKRNADASTCIVFAIGLNDLNR